MTPGPSGSQDDPLDEAHLLFIRGQLAEAREILETYLQRVPGDSAALRLLDKIERRQVEQTLVREERVASARSLVWIEEHLPFVVAAGLLLMAFAVYRAIEPIRLGFQCGFTTRVHYVVTMRGGQYPNTGPIHNLLIFPALHFIIGCALLGLAYRYYRHASD